jgi:hypothetical protein
MASYGTPPWEYSDGLQGNRHALKCLASPFGVKHKNGFELKIWVHCELD